MSRGWGVLQAACCWVPLYSHTGTGCGESCHGPNKLAQPAATPQLTNDGGDQAHGARHSRILGLLSNVGGRVVANLSGLSSGRATLQRFMQPSAAPAGKHHGALNCSRGLAAWPA